MFCGHPFRLWVTVMCLIIDYFRRKVDYINEKRKKTLDCFGYHDIPVISNNVFDIYYVVYTMGETEWNLCLL